MSKLAHDPADGWTAITSETDWPAFDSEWLDDPIPVLKHPIKKETLTPAQLAAGIAVYRTYQDQVFPAIESVVREIYIAMQAAK